MPDDEEESSNAYTDLLDIPSMEIRDVPRDQAPRQLTEYGPSYRLYYSAPYRARRAKLRSILKRKLLQQERHALSVTPVTTSWLDQVVHPQPPATTPPSVCPCDFQMHTARLKEEYDMFYMNCAIIDNFLHPDKHAGAGLSTTEALELDYCLSVQHEDNSAPLKYRALVQGPEAEVWLEHSSQEWDPWGAQAAILTILPAMRSPCDGHGR